MVSNIMTDSCIALLRKLYPVTGLLHVGDVGRHTVSEYSELATQSVMFVISEEAQHELLSALIECYPRWKSVRAVLAELPAEREYFKASNPRESGLLAPERLAGIWRNIKTLSSHSVVAKTLQIVLDDLAGDSAPTNWIVVNCLPAISVLRGGGASLDECDVHSFCPGRPRSIGVDRFRIYVVLIGQLPWGSWFPSGVRSRGASPRIGQRYLRSRLARVFLGAAGDFRRGTREFCLSTGNRQINHRGPQGAVRRT